MGTLERSMGEQGKGAVDDIKRLVKYVSTVEITVVILYQCEPVKGDAVCTVKSLFCGDLNFKLRLS